MIPSKSPGPAFKISVRFSSSRRFPDGNNEIRVGPYLLRPIPSADGEEAILDFIDEWVGEQKAANPVQEARFILSWLAVALESRLIYKVAEINSSPSLPAVPLERFQKSMTPIPDMEQLLDRFLGLPEKQLRTYLRACELYHLGIQVIDERPSLAIFLLVSSIECIANMVLPGPNFQQSYASFIERFCPEDQFGNVPKDMMPKMISKMYEFRSRYAHGGKDVPIASLLAARRGLGWVKHYVDGKEELAPSPDWFSHIVQASLISYLRSSRLEKPEVRTRTKLRDLALSMGTAHFKSKRAIQQGQAVTADDVELQ